MVVPHSAPRASCGLTTARPRQPPHHPRPPTQRLFATIAKAAKRYWIIHRRLTRKAHTQRCQINLPIQLRCGRSNAGPGQAFPRSVFVSPHSHAVRSATNICATPASKVCQKRVRSPSALRVPGAKECTSSGPSGIPPHRMVWRSWYTWLAMFLNMVTNSKQSEVNARPMGKLRT